MIEASSCTILLPFAPSFSLRYATLASRAAQRLGCKLLAGRDCISSKNCRAARRCCPDRHFQGRRWRDCCLSLHVPTRKGYMKPICTGRGGIFLLFSRLRSETNCWLTGTQVFWLKLHLICFIPYKWPKSLFSLSLKNQFLATSSDRILVLTNSLTNPAQTTQRTLAAAVRPTSQFKGEVLRVSES